MLRVGEFNANINNQWIVGAESSMIGETRLLPELSRARTCCWVDESKETVQLSATEVANKCVMKFLDLANRADQGEITNPSQTTFEARDENQQMSPGRTEDPLVLSDP